MHKTLIITILFISSNLAAQSPKVSTAQGSVIGYTESGINIFKAIPFASPPVGPLRWKAPQDPVPWTGDKVCTEFSASPMQREPKPFSCWTEEFIAPPSPLSEDCLYLNVWTKPDGKKKPVVVWIYGGGFNSGSAACAVYEGKYYAQQGIVFVGINYRVNIFGFFAHPELTATSGGKGDANFGLLDQLQSLKWVHQNIAAFGGDPDNVTIMGQSAGSFSVHALVASPLAKGLFHKAIGHSGGILGSNRGVSLAMAEANGTKLVSQLGAGSIEDLRVMPAEELLAKAGKFNPPYSPVLDGYFLPTNIESHYASDLHNDVPVLTGWVTGDGALSGNTQTQPQDFKQQIKKNYPQQAAQLLKLFPADNATVATASNSKMRRLSFGAVPAITWAQYNRSPVYVYEFDHVPAPKPDFPDYGAFHTADVPFALHTLDTWQRPWRATDLSMEKMMSQYWINFIKTGSPNGKGLTQWHAYESKNKSVMQLKLNGKLVKGMYQAELAAMKSE